MQSSSRISEKWIKASVIGTIWAASEIVIGSFLHNLKVPFSSNLLTGIGIIILISSSYKWKETGLFWRAGLICALMKTISPSAVIFGPMVAIFSQAFLMELSVRIFRGTIPGYFIGAMMAMSWNLVQKILNFIIFYGFNIVEIYKDLLKTVQKELSINFDIVWLPIIILLIIYSLFGILSAFIGIRTGRKLQQIKSEKKPVRTAKAIVKEETNSKEFKYSTLWLLADFLLIVNALILLNFTEWHFWGPAVLLSTLVWIYRYKRALRQLSKPRFWIFFVLITMATAFLFSEAQSKGWESGLLIGLKMNFRAVIVILGFSVLGTELYNPAIRKFFLKTSFKQLPLALELSFKSLPVIIANTPDFKTLIKKPVSIIYGFVSQIEFRLDETKRNLERKVFIITGSVESGKTSTLKELIPLLEMQKIKTQGIITLRVLENEKTTGYDVFDSLEKKKTAFLRINDTNSKQQIGRFQIIEKGLKEGKQAIQKATDSDSHFVIIDEIGMLELENKGWSEEIDKLIFDTNKNLIITTRDHFAERVVNKWGFLNYMKFNVEEKDAHEIAKDIISNFKE